MTVLGTGLMGAPMAATLVRSGFAVTVWNRDPARAAPLARLGARVAPDPGTAVAQAEVVVSMLTDGAAVLAVMDRAAPHLPRGALWLDMSSTRPEEARAQADRLAARGVGHLDAPVSGGTGGAEAGTLAIMVGGPEAVLARARPVLDALGRPVRVGPSGAGQLAKLANQAIVGVTIGVVAEAMLLIERGGGDAAALRAALRGGFADSTVLQLHGARMTDGDFAPGGRASVQLKDLRNISSEAEALGLSLPLVEAVRARFDHLVETMGAGARDHAALYLELLARQPR